MKTWGNQQLKDLIHYLNENGFMYSMAEIIDHDGDILTFEDKDRNYQITLYGCEIDNMRYFKTNLYQPWHRMMDILQMIPFVDEVEAHFEHPDGSSDTFTVK